LRRVAVVASAVLAALIATGCASADHTWRGEFTARLEGASAVVEEVREELRSHSPEELLTTFERMGEALSFKAELVKKLKPPAGCEAVQVRGKSAVTGAANLVGGYIKDFGPDPGGRFPVALEEQLALLEKGEREAAHCETG
jgi:hypothetical protein